MNDSYFGRLAAQTPTRMWVNNPTEAETAAAIATGAVGCTTNPTFMANLLRRAPAEAAPVIEACLELATDEARVADLIQERLVARVAERFLPIHEASAGQEGFVSIQGAPAFDTDAGHILGEANAARDIAPNVIPKIPATAAGLAAMDVLVRAGSQLIITEVFSLAQLVAACEVYERVVAETRVRPPFFISPITGIFADYLKKTRASVGIEVPDAAIDLVGVALVKQCYAIVRERGYGVILLAGGARKMHDFTGLTGGRVHATINWSTAAEIIALDPPIRPTLLDPIEPELMASLAAFDDVRTAFALDGLAVVAFAEFGPVQHFRAAFSAGWDDVLASIRTAREARALGVA